MKHKKSLSFLISSGSGPAECHQAVAWVLARIRDEVCGADLEMDVSTTPSTHGIKSAVVVVHGVGHGEFFNRWGGTIRWRAKSTLRPNHKRTNWYIGVFLLARNKTKQVEVLPGDVAFESFRAGGPGGQHQNTTDSAVRATHRPTGLTVVARELRSQHRNKALALERLQALMAAQADAETEARKSEENRLHNSLERGNPIRCFKGPDFQEERCQ